MCELGPTPILGPTAIRAPTMRPTRHFNGFCRQQFSSFTSRTRPVFRRPWPAFTQSSQRRTILQATGSGTIIASLTQPLDFNFKGCEGAPTTDDWTQVVQTDDVDGLRQLVWKEVRAWLFTYFSGTIIDEDLQPATLSYLKGFTYQHKIQGYSGFSHPKTTRQLCQCFA